MRRGQLNKFRKMAGLTKDTDLALRMGVARQTVARAVSGESNLSAAFIGGLLSAFPHLAFEDLFEIAEDEPNGEDSEHAGAA